VQDGLPGVTRFDQSVGRVLSRESRHGNIYGAMTFPVISASTTY